MEKGLFILLITFIVVGIMHFVSMKLMNLPEAKKAKYGNFFWYFYGLVLILSGGLNLFEKDALTWIYVIQLALGVLILILNFRGKLSNKAR